MNNLIIIKGQSLEQFTEPFQRKRGPFRRNLEQSEAKFAKIQIPAEIHPRKKKLPEHG